MLRKPSAIFLSLCAAATMCWGAANDTRLVEAAKNGDHTAAMALMAQHVDVNALEPDGSTALHWAVHSNDVELVDRLLSAGAHAQVKNQYGIAPIAEGAVVGNIAILKRLLDAGADPNSANDDGQTALMVIARTNNTEAASLLISKGANVNLAEQWRGQTALMWAAAEGKPAMVKLLAAHGAEVNQRSRANSWDRQVTSENRAKYMPLGGFTALLFAARQGQFEAAKALVDAGADKDLADPDGVTPMITATVNGHYDIAAMLAEKGADVNLADRWGRAELWAAVDMDILPHSGRPDPIESEYNCTDLLKVLLDHGAEVNAQLVTFPPYRSMSDRGADGILTIGATPLLRAAKAGDLVAVKMLLDKGADPNLPNKTGVTPLMAASGVGSRDNDTRGRYKTEQDAIETARMLLDKGADIKAAEDRGQTALHGAAFWGWNQMVQFLADHGAPLNVKDKRDKTPIDSAMGRAGGNGFGGNRIDVHKDTADLLEKLIASSGSPSAQLGSH